MHMESAGGVKLISGTKRISIDNTLDERLRLLEDRVRLNAFILLSRCVLNLYYLCRCYQKSGRTCLARMTIANSTTSTSSYPALVHGDVL
jgi:hypothetical protein